jgi:hypothetical protein
VDEEQNIVNHRPAQRPNGLREEVGRPKRFHVQLNEFAPGFPTALRADVEAAFRYYSP